MSAFIVTTETMHHVVDAIYAHHHRSESFTWAGMLCHDCKSLDAIGAALFALNAEAVSQRYNEPPEEMAPYKTDLKYASATHHYRAIACLVYQCSEGSIPERPLYQALVDLGNAVARKIADGLCEAHKVPWDFPDPLKGAPKRISLASLATK